MRRLLKKIPQYLREEYQLTATVVFTAFFSLVLILVSIPFSHNAWFELGTGEAFGYTESMDGTVIDQPDSALMAVRVVLGVLPGVIFLVSIVFSHRANMGRDRFNTIKEELAKRRAAAEDDVSGESAVVDTADSASHGGGKFAE